MTCPTCGLELTMYSNTNGVYVWHCENAHWWQQDTKIVGLDFIAINDPSTNITLIPDIA